MKPNSPTDLHDLYLYAQLVADDPDEASSVLRMALDARHRGDRREADILIRDLYGESINDSGAWLARRQVPTALEELLPRLMAQLRPTRRMAIVKAFRSPDPDESDQSVFLVSVKRALETDGKRSAAEKLTLESLQESMRRYMDSHMAPVPEPIQEAWESRYDDSPERMPARQARRFPLSARIAAGVLIILLSAAIGSWMTSPSSDAPSVQSELFDELSDLDTDSPEFRASDPEQVERFVADRLDWRVTVPRLEGGRIEGVSIARLSSDLQFPVLHYHDEATDSELKVHVIDYRFLEAARAIYLVDSRILDQIAESGSVDVRNAPDFFRVTWRFRDDIFVAVPSSPDPDLRNRFRYE